MKTPLGERAGAAADDYPEVAPAPVRRPALLHTWSELSFVHWPHDPAVIRALVPEPLTVDVVGDAAWVGLVPFHCTIRPPAMPRLHWVSSFEEMNVRTYVRGPDGLPGVWFITLDAARLGAVLIARLTYGLNYFWSKMRFARVGDVVTYSSRRRWPKPGNAVGTLALEVDSPIAHDPSPLERFLTARWAFYGRVGPWLYRGHVDHKPWRLEDARLLHCDAGLVRACGLPEPAGEPIVHHAQPVEVRMSAPTRLQTEKGRRIEHPPPFRPTRSRP
jgi:uncharacterized protein